MSTAERQALTLAARWRPAPLLVFSALLHAVALLGLWWRPDSWPVWLLVIVADHLLLMAVSLWPRSSWLGPNVRRLSAAAAARGEVAITIDDGPDPEVTPQVLDLLARASARATFFCVGEQALRHPELCRRLVAEGHEVENHGQRHPTLASLMGPGGWRREVAQGADTLQSLTGRRPVYYRAVAGLRNPFLDPVLHRLGLQLASWTRRGFDTRTREPSRVLQRLLKGLQAGDVLLLHDGHAARTADGQPVIVAVLPALIEALRARGLRPVTLGEARRQV